MVLLTPKQLKKIKKKMMHEKDITLQHLQHNDHFGVKEALRDSVSELSAYDNHPADIGTEVFERAKDFALNQQMKRHLDELEHALKRIDDKEFGICTVCGKTIAYKRLLAMPTAVVCVNHSLNREVTDSTKWKEHRVESNEPKWDTFLDYEEKELGINAWQIVESWGTSSHSLESLSDDDEHDGYVQTIESFLVTDITGKHISVVRNDEYRAYMSNQEGDRSLEVD